MNCKHALHSTIRIRLQRFFLLYFTSVAFFFSTAMHADTQLTQRKEVQQFITTMVEKHGFNRQALNLLLDKVQIQPQIIESMEKPYEKKPWDTYKKIFLTP